MDPPLPLALIDQETWLNDHGLQAAQDVQEATAEERDDELRVKREEHYAAQVIGGILKEDFPEQDEACFDELDILEGRFATFAAQDQETVTAVPLCLALQECDYFAMILKSKGNWNNTLDENGNLTVSLKDYPVGAVQAFVEMLQLNGEEDRSIDPSIQGETLLDMCRIAHFLCAERILNIIHDELLKCVDNTSCLVLCQLAEELSLSRLMEASLARMMDSLDNDTDVNDLTPELREKINQIKGAISSSLNSGSRLFFGSMEEYLAIFAERVYYFEERLLEAREQFAVSEADMSVLGRIDALQKISRQEKRVMTLQTALQEQRKLFLSKPGDINRRSNEKSA